MKNSNINLSLPHFPHTMGDSEKEYLIDTLYNLHCRIFDGVEKTDFRRYVVEPNTRTTEIRFFQNRQLENVGYITFQVFEVEVEGKTGLVYRTEVGMLPEYRGKNSTFSFLFRKCALNYIKSGFKPSWFLATPIHPNPYCVAQKNLAEMYPQPHQETPSSILGLMQELSLKLGISNANAEQPLAKKVGWIVRNTLQQRRRVLESQDESVRFYLQQNPNYDQGNGLMMLIPFKWINVWSGVGNMLNRTLKPLKKRISGVSFRLPSLSQLLKA